MFYFAGGAIPANLADEETNKALKVMLMEFKRRAYTIGNMKARDTIVIGDIIEIRESVCKLVYVPANVFVFWIGILKYSNSNRIYFFVITKFNSGCFWI